MKLRFSDHAHAIVKSIDLSEAKKLPGVVAIYTAKDVPNNEYGLIMMDQPVLCGPGSNKAYGDHVRFIGDQIAAVVAESEDIAKKACQLIKIEYEVLPVLADARIAKNETHVLVHPDKDSNIFLP